MTRKQKPLRFWHEDYGRLSHSTWREWKLWATLVMAAVVFVTAATTIILACRQFEHHGDSSSCRKYGEMASIQTEFVDLWFFKWECYVMVDDRAIPLDTYVDDRRFFELNEWDS